jgi:hypothetical protein
MRELAYQEIHERSIESFLEWFNECHSDGGITKESDIISMTVREDTKPHKIQYFDEVDGVMKDGWSKVVICFFHWR